MCAFFAPFIVHFVNLFCSESSPSSLMSASNDENMFLGDNQDENSALRAGLREFWERNWDNICNPGMLSPRTREEFGDVRFAFGSGLDLPYSAMPNLPGPPAVMSNLMANDLTTVQSPPRPTKYTLPPLDVDDSPVRTPLSSAVANRTETLLPRIDKAAARKLLAQSGAKGIDDTPTPAARSARVPVERVLVLVVSRPWILLN
ncbi:hypothetical protein BDZ89DRAFT_719784 [Hymenopellis radicata]|nr:hypothetical protein BDZ89DRAFT_719784 [Hymenopellis radicata]